MATLTLFKSRAPSMGYVFRSGRTIHFVNGEFATANKDEIEELTKECEAGHPCYYIDNEKTKIESEALDPLAALRAKIREEERLKLLANQDRDMGKTEFSGKLEGIANTRTVQQLAVESGTDLATPLKQSDGGAVVQGSIKVAASATATKL